MLRIQLIEMNVLRSYAVPYTQSVKGNYNNARYACTVVFVLKFCCSAAQRIHRFYWEYFLLRNTQNAKLTKSSEHAFTKFVDNFHWISIRFPAYSVGFVIAFSSRIQATVQCWCARNSIRRWVACFCFALPVALFGNNNKIK